MFKTSYISQIASVTLLTALYSIVAVAPSDAEAVDIPISTTDPIESPVTSQEQPETISTPSIKPQEKQQQVQPPNVNPQTLSSEFPEVLTIAEAATFLRRTPEEVQQLAEKGSLPGRLIGKEWLFSRRSLLAWLEGEKIPTNSDKIPSASVPIPPSQALSPPTNANPSTPTSEKPEPSGQAPEESILLPTQSVLLNPNQLVVDLNLYYTNKTRSNFELLPLPNGLVSVPATVKQDSFVSQLGVRYGLQNNLEISASIPLSSQTSTITVFDQQQSNRQGVEFGGLSVGLRRVVMNEGLGRPTIIARLSGQIPTGQSSYGIGADVNISKRLDPVELFANFGYNHTFSRNFEDIARLEPRDVFSATFGYDYFLNDRVSLSTLVSGVFQGRTNFDDVLLQAQKRFSLQLGLAYAASESLSIRPTVSFGLNEEGSNVTFGVNLSHMFKK